MLIRSLLLSLSFVFLPKAACAQLICASVFTASIPTYTPLELERLKISDIAHWQWPDYVKAFQEGVEPDFYDNTQRALFKRYLNEQQVALNTPSPNSPMTESQDRYEDLVFTYVQLKKLYRPLLPHISMSIKNQGSYKLRQLSAAETLGLGHFQTDRTPFSIQRLYELESRHIHFTLTSQPQGFSQGLIRITLGEAGLEPVALAEGTELLPEPLTNPVRLAIYELMKNYGYQLVLPLPSEPQAESTFVANPPERFTHLAEPLPRPVAFFEDSLSHLESQADSMKIELSLVKPFTLPRLGQGQRL